ncbi:MAG: cation transporter [Candidatus Vogelbacteria bacterium]|nr:cation transporter [Candidatus Vogelbacteria bacterium]
MKTTITISGTHCNACRLLIEDMCRDVKNVQSCNVNFQTGETVIEHDENLDLQVLKNEIESSGNYVVALNR